MQAAGLVLGVGNRSLANAAKQIFNLDVPKGMRSSDWSAPRFSPGQIAYAAADAVVTYLLWPKLATALRKNKTAAAYGLQRDAVPAVVDMELRGLGFARDEHTRHVEAWERELAEAQRQYTAETGQPPPSTPNEIRGWLVTVLDAAKLTRWPRTDKGELLSVASDHPRRLVHLPGARAVLKMLAHQKLLSTFGPGLADHINQATGRLHAHYNLAGWPAPRPVVSPAASRTCSSCRTRARRSSSAASSPLPVMSWSAVIGLKSSCVAWRGWRVTSMR
jgi:hypothetical protein